MEEVFDIESPTDIELGLKRDRLRYYVTYPNQGISEDTGLLFFIGGHGMRPNSEYERTKLRPYLAEKSNCLAVGVEYCGVDLKGGGLQDHAMLPGPFFQQTIQNVYGINQEEYLENNAISIFKLKDLFKQRNIYHVDPRAYIVFLGKQRSYLSFGFMPAVDHLTVLSNLLKQFRINKKKIIAYGTSYGGYIALLLGKYAPRTFSTIIDNSGYVKTNMAEIIDNEVKLNLCPLTLEGVTFAGVSDNRWTILDEHAPNYFSDSHRKIRSLLEEQHFNPTDTRYFSFHSIYDEVIPVKEKDDYVQLLKKYAKVYYKRINEDDIDGKLFKNKSHGMDASLKGLFDIVSDQSDLSKIKNETDFDKNSTISFDCNERVYRFHYTDDHSFHLERELSSEKLE